MGSCSDLEQLKERNYVSRPTFKAIPIVEDIHILQCRMTRGSASSWVASRLCDYMYILLVASYISHIPEYISCYIIRSLENNPFSNEVLKARFVSMFSKHVI